MRNKVVEGVVGLFLIVAMIALVVLAFKVSGFSYQSQSDYYKVYAMFDNIGGLRERATVSMSGVPIGSVESITLDPETYQAKVTLLLSKTVKNLPDDSEASIFTQGILGANYIHITPGFDTSSLKAGDTIQKTHSAMILENLIGQLVFSLKGDDKNKTESGTGADNNAGAVTVGTENNSAATVTAAPAAKK